MKPAANYNGATVTTPRSLNAHRLCGGDCRIRVRVVVTYTHLHTHSHTHPHTHTLTHTYIYHHKTAHSTVCVTQPRLCSRTHNNILLAHTPCSPTLSRRCLPSTCHRLRHRPPELSIRTHPLRSLPHARAPQATAPRLHMPSCCCTTSHTSPTHAHFSTTKQLSSPDWLWALQIWSSPT